MNDERQISRGTLLRDAVVFQGKLLLDGVRDLLLVPVSLIAALISWLHAGRDSGRAFYEVVRLGRRSERWIDLFSAAERIEGSDGAPAQMTVDEMLDRIERGIVDQYRKNDGRIGVAQLRDVVRAARTRFASAAPGRDADGAPSATSGRPPDGRPD